MTLTRIMQLEKMCSNGFVLFLFNSFFFHFYMGIFLNVGFLDVEVYKKILNTVDMVLGGILLFSMFLAAAYSWYLEATGVERIEVNSITMTRIK